MDLRVLACGDTLVEWNFAIRSNVARDGGCVWGRGTPPRFGHSSCLQSVRTWLRICSNNNMFSDLVEDPENVDSVQEKSQGFIYEKINK